MTIGAKGGYAGLNFEWTEEKGLQLEAEAGTKPSLTLGRGGVSGTIEGLDTGAKLTWSENGGLKFEGHFKTEPKFTLESGGASGSIQGLHAGASIEADKDGFRFKAEAGVAPKFTFTPSKGGDSYEFSNVSAGGSVVYDQKSGWHIESSFKVKPTLRINHPDGTHEDHSFTLAEGEANYQGNGIWKADVKAPWFSADFNGDPRNEFQGNIQIFGHNIPYRLGSDKREANSAWRNARLELRRQNPGPYGAAGWSDAELDDRIRALAKEKNMDPDKVAKTLEHQYDVYSGSAGPDSGPGNGSFSNGAGDKYVHIRNGRDELVPLKKAIEEHPDKRKELEADAFPMANGGSPVAGQSYVNVAGKFMPLKDAKQKYPNDSDLQQHAFVNGAGTRHARSAGSEQLSGSQDRHQIGDQSDAARASLDTSQLGQQQEHKPQDLKQPNGQDTPQAAMSGQPSPGSQKQAQAEPHAQRGVNPLAEQQGKKLEDLKESQGQSTSAQPSVGVPQSSKLAQPQGAGEQGVSSGSAVSGPAAVDGKSAMRAAAADPKGLQSAADAHAGGNPDSQLNDPKPSDVLARHAQLGGDAAKFVQDGAGVTGGSAVSTADPKGQVAQPVGGTLGKEQADLAGQDAKSAGQQADDSKTLVGSDGAGSATPGASSGDHWDRWRQQTFGQRQASPEEKSAADVSTVTGTQSPQAGGGDLSKPAAAPSNPAGTAGSGAANGLTGSDALKAAGSGLVDASSAVKGLRRNKSLLPWLLVVVVVWGCWRGLRRLWPRSSRRCSRTWTSVSAGWP
ncbi:hypothetical protein [Streptomyces sp. V4I8]|uniref:hypothetical protein n=1 Tax=Streptomyces sp. V4I8 TaxID=3156469 RepID=UPI003512C376